MDTGVFRRFSTLARDQAGISFKDGKEGLIAGRIAKRMRALCLHDAREYLEVLEADRGGEEVSQFIDAVSTNFTSFFREPDHFQLLARAVSGWVASGQRRLRIWSAASSSGEEPYSIAMTVREAIGDHQVDVKILATDISDRVLQQARAGVYPGERVATVPEAMRRRWFRSVAGEPDQFVISPEIARTVAFRKLNLSAPPFPMRGPFDFVFCRNVLIYFEQPVRAGLIGSIEKLLRPGGWLCIGHTETLTGLRSGLRFVEPSVFHKPEAVARGEARR